MTALIRQLVNVLGSRDFVSAEDSHLVQGVALLDVLLYILEQAPKLLALLAHVADLDISSMSLSKLVQK